MLQSIDETTIFKDLNNESTSKENQIDNSSYLTNNKVSKISQEELDSSQRTTQTSQNDSMNKFCKWAIQDSQTDSSQKISSQELFGSDYENLPKYPNSQTSSQNSNPLTQNSLLNKFNPILNLNITTDSECKLTPNSIISISSSQKTNYFEVRDDKLKLPLTPDESQEDGEKELFTDEDDYEQLDDNDTVIDLNQKLNYSNDEDDYEQLDDNDTVIDLNQKLNYSNDQNFNKSQHPYIKNISYIKKNNPVDQQSKYLSKGKSNNIVDKLKSINEKFNFVDNDLNQNIGKSIENCYEESMQIDENFENNHFTVENNKLSSFNHSIGKCDQSNSLIGFSKYQYREQKLKNANSNVYRNRSNMSECCDTISHISRSSTPVNYVTTIEDAYNDESSNDSLIRKRKKINESSSENILNSKPKITKISNQGKDEMKSLSQQMEGSCLIDDTQFSYYDNLNAYFTNDSSKSKSFPNDSSSNSNLIASKSQSNNSFTRITRSNSKESTPKFSDLSTKSLNNFEESIETPIKRHSLNTLGPIPKSSNKKTRSTRKSKQEDNFKRTPVQRKLNISEVSPNFTQSNDKLSNTIESISKTKTATRQTRKKAESLSSAKSFDSLVSDLNETDFDKTYVDKKERRKMNNKDAAKKYRQCQKEKEIQLEDNLKRIQSNYSELQEELRKLIVQKNSLIKMLIDDNEETLPDDIKKSKLLI